MKYIRFEKNGIIQRGFIEDEAICVIKSDSFDLPTETHYKYNLGEAKILPPVIPSKVIAVGLNYIDHAKELSLPLPEELLIFLKPPSSVIGPDDTIYYPLQTMRLDYEAELAIVIVGDKVEVRIEGLGSLINSVEK